MIDIPETHECARKRDGKQCACVSSPTQLRSCKHIVPVREPGERVNLDPGKAAARRAAVSEAYDKVERLLKELTTRHAFFGANPLMASARRLQAQTFSELSQAQFELEQALTFVPPRTGNEP